MVEYSEAFIGIDAAKSRNAIAIGEAGREGEIRYPYHPSNFLVRWTSL